MDDYVVPERRLVEYLLWHVHATGLCCAVSDPFAAYLAGRFTRVGIMGLDIATVIGNDSKLSRLLMQYWGSHHSFNLGD
jgi:hypothetical protein